MSWISALALVLEVEGGYVQSNPPEGVTFAGILQGPYEAWAAKCGRDKSWPPTREAVGSYYYDQYWVEFHCPEFRFPTGSIAMQLVVNLPPQKAKQALQVALGVEPDGAMGPKTLAAIKNFHPVDLSDRILIAQAMHYCDARSVGDPVLVGLMNRIAKVRDWLRTHNG